MDIHIDITVTGQVQGVGFRAFTVLKARQLGLTGYTQNQLDGSVYISVEGSPDKIQQLLAWCMEGPPLAKVTNVTSRQGNLQGYQTFKVEP